MSDLRRQCDQENQDVPSVAYIRARMAKLQTAEVTGRSASSNHSSTTSPMSQPLKTEMRSKSPRKNTENDLAHLADEVLIYCHLLDSSRRRTLDDCSSLRKTIRELERLLESARQREVNQLSCVEQLREAISMFEKRYYGLKSRARTLLRECQEEKDRMKEELDELTQKYKRCETQLYSAQSTLDTQEKELERLRDQCKNTPSEKELHNMRLKILRLEDENGRLATERAQLMVQLDEIQGGKSTKTNRADADRPKRDEEMENANKLLKSELIQLKTELAEHRKENSELKTYVDLLLRKITPSES